MLIYVPQTVFNSVIVCNYLFSGFQYSLAIYYEIPSSSLRSISTIFIDIMLIHIHVYRLHLYQGVPLETALVLTNMHRRCQLPLVSLAKSSLTYLYAAVITKSCTARTCHVKTTTFSLYNDPTSRTSFPLVFARQFEKL
jgi:hypothetical protein